MVNMIVNNGLNLALKRIFGLTANAVAYMGVGTSSATPTESTSALGSECTSANGGYTRVAISNTQDTANKRVVSSATFINTNITTSTTIREIALFDASTGGTLFAICQIPATVKDSGTSYTFKITTTAVRP